MSRVERKLNHLLIAGSAILTCRHCSLFELVLAVIKITPTVDTYKKKIKNKVTILAIKRLQKKRID